MTIEYLLDTDVVSEPTRPKPNKHVMRRWAHHRDRVATASVVWHELLYGCQLLPDSARRHKMEKYLDEAVRRTMPILAYTAEAAAWHAAERARLELRGQSPPHADSQIAAVAKVNGLTLVTNNVRDFENFDGLKIENWFR